MEVGAIGFHDNSKVKNIWVTKDKDIVKIVDKTKKVFIPYHSYIYIYII